jgi:hypothetical protein
VCGLIKITKFSVRRFPTTLWKLQNTKDEARRIAENIAKQSEYCKGQKANESTFDPVLF